jgi:hypothetical protein
VPKETVAPAKAAADEADDFLARDLARVRSALRAGPPVIPCTPKQACSILARFVATDESAGVVADVDFPGLPRPFTTDRVIHAWRVISYALWESRDVLPHAVDFVRFLLLHIGGDLDLPPTKRIKDPDYAASVKVSLLALASLRGDRSARASVRKMAELLDPLGGSQKAALRQRIKDAVAWSNSNHIAPHEERRLDDDGHFVIQEVSETERRRRRVEFLCEALPEIDPRLALDEATVRSIVRLHGRKNSTNRLAAEWAWRAGLEGEPRAGESLSDDAPARVVDRYRDVVKKLATRKGRKVRKWKETKRTATGVWTESEL